MKPVKLYHVITTVKPSARNTKAVLRRHHNERWCHESDEDLIPAGPTEKGAIVQRFMRCRWCGQLMEYHRFRDAAGSSDWEYRPCPETTLPPTEGKAE